MSLFWKAMIGAGAVFVIGLLARTRSFYLAGLVPLFPTFALMTHYIVGTERSVSDLKTTIVFGMWSIIPFFVYFASPYFFVDQMKLVWALSGSVALWCIAATVLVFAWGRG